MTIAEAAAFLAQTWPVFPVAQDKRPLTSHGYKDATRDPDTARFMCRHAHGIGIPTGQVSGIIAIDIDVKDGRAGLQWLAATEHRLPRTRRHGTRSGGLHLLFLAPIGRTIRNSASRIAPGVDVRGDGGFIVAPPTPGYTITDDAMPAPIPAWLLDLLDPPRPAPEPRAAPTYRATGDGTPYGLAALDRECQAIMSAADGAKHDTLNRAAYSIGGLVTAGEIPEGDARRALESALAGIRHRCEDYPAAQRTLSQAFRDGMAAPRHPPAPRLIRRVTEEYEPPPPHLEPPPIDAPPDHWGAEPEIETPDDPAPDKGAPLWVDTTAPDADPIPPRPWIVPSYFMRGSVSVLSGQGAGGKSSLVVAWTIALATGRPINGFEPYAPTRVINYNTEDDQDEQRRRYSAALTAQGVASAEIAGRVIRCGPHNIGTLFERDPASGRITPTAALQQLEDMCHETGAEVLICDPLAELHNAEENDNTAMRAVIAAFRSMAQRLGIAVLILHHDRKGNNAPGDMDRVRGASAISGAVRVMLTLTTMSAEEAEKFGIPPDQRRRHFRIDGAKSNYAPATDAEWWRLDGYEISNGETVAAALPWAPPTAFDGISMDTCIAILNRIAEGTNGAPFGAGGKARGELFAVLESEPFNLPEGRAKAILAAWMTAGLVYEMDGCKSPNSRHPRRGLLVNETKFSEMRRQ
jgi:hypothetical protein